MKRFYISLISTIVLVFIFNTNTSIAQTYKMYVGTYTSGNESKGVYVYDFDEKTGSASLVKSIAMSNPSFLTRKDNILYAVNEDVKGMLTAYDLKNDKVISHVSTNGMHPCHIALSPKDPIAVVSNYSSGSLSLYALEDDGRIRHMDDFLKFTGSSINKDRQNESHIHSAFFTKDGSRVFVSDLGADLIYVFEIISRDGQFKFNKVDEIKTKLGGGPRHLAFSKDGKTIYSVLEMTGEVQVFQKSNNHWESKQIIPMYPKDFNGEHGGADIKISKNGKNIFATNRGTANLLYHYKVKSNGLLRQYHYSSVFGDSPRNINLSPKEKAVFIANQNTSNITTFSKKLKNTKVVDRFLQIPKPVCVIF